MEVGSVVEISLLSRVTRNLKSSKVILCELNLTSGSELFFSRRAISFCVFTVDSSSGRFSKRLGMDVLRLNLGNVTSIPRDVLSFNISVGTTEPVISML
jgi:hypothetical protein